MLPFENAFSYVALYCGSEVSPNNKIVIINCFNVFRYSQTKKVRLFKNKFSNCCDIFKFFIMNKALKRNAWAIHQWYLLKCTKMYLINLSHIWLCNTEVVISPNNTIVIVRCLNMFWHILTTGMRPFLTVCLKYWMLILKGCP